MPGTVLGTKDLSLNQSDKQPRPHRANILVGGSGEGKIRVLRVIKVIKCLYIAFCLELSGTSAYLFPEKVK